MLTQSMQQLVTTTMTAFMLLMQCVTSVPSACGCSAAAQTDAVANTCCHQLPDAGEDLPSKVNAGHTCCSSENHQCVTEKCTCGMGDTACSCGSQDQNEEPVPAREREQRSENELKSLSAAMAARSAVCRLGDDDRTVRVVSHSECVASIPVQILLCTWRT